MNIFYPNIISNDNLYKITNTKPILDEIFQSRWKYFGHVLRHAQQHLAFNFILYYYIIDYNQFKIGHKITYPKLLHQNLQLLNLNLITYEDLNYLQQKAKNRLTWLKFIDELYSKYVMVKNEKFTKQKKKKIITNSIQEKLNKKPKIINLITPNNIISILQQQQEDHTTTNSKKRKKDTNEKKQKEKKTKTESAIPEHSRKRKHMENIQDDHQKRSFSKKVKKQSFELLL
jgi:hypothetical protein